MISLSVPNISVEWKYVKECLDTEWVSSAGKYVDLFEEKLANFVGSRNIPLLVLMGRLLYR